MPFCAPPTDRTEAIVPVQIGGYACGYQAIFVPSIALASPGYDGQPAVYLYIAIRRPIVRFCRDEGVVALA
jgi:hypothetical protein